MNIFRCRSGSLEDPIVKGKIATMLQDWEKRSRTPRYLLQSELNVSPQTVDNYLRGVTTPDAIKLCIITAVYSGFDRTKFLGMIVEFYDALLIDLIKESQAIAQKRAEELGEQLSKISDNDSPDGNV